MMEAAYVEIHTIPVDRPYVFFFAKDKFDAYLQYVNNKIEVSGELREWLDINAGQRRVDWHITPTVTDESYSSLMGASRTGKNNILVSFRDREIAMQFKLAWV